MAVAIWAAAASGTAVASPDTLSSNSVGESTQQTSELAPTTEDTTSDSAAADQDADPEDEATDPEAEAEDLDREAADRAAAEPEEEPEPAAPSPDDEASTEYGDIGKWMLQPDGEIADYGDVPHDGKTVLEAVNVVIVDPSSRSTLGATWKLNAAMRRAGFPPRLFHSTGFRGLIDGQSYRQQPRGLLVGYSDDFFLLPNNHGRIFGPAPVETASGYVWSGSFSTETLAVYNGLPRHVYVSSEAARTALTSKLVASGRATLSGMVALGNSYNTETTTTGDHDGYAVVVTLNDLRAIGAAMTAANLVDRGRSRTECPALSPCALITAGH